MRTLRELTDEALSLRQSFAQTEASTPVGRWTRGEIFRGFVADVGALAKLTMAADGVRIVPEFREKLGHELADCLWSVLVLSHEYDVELEAEFTKMVASEKARLASRA